MKTIAEALAELKVNRPDGKRYVEDWQKGIPSWSKWSPGSMGKPDCSMCKGLGVVRVDVSLRHPFFGKLFACECQSGPVVQRAVSPPADDLGDRRSHSIERARKDLD